MDFRKLNGATFRVWTYLCDVCRYHGNVQDVSNRFVNTKCNAEIARYFKYNPQTVSQSLHRLKEEGFISEAHDPLYPRQSAYFLHAIRMGECIPLPANAERLVQALLRQEVMES